jgi:hypothetical protein
MTQRHPIEIIYRGERLAGEWYVENGSLHVTSVHGRMSGAATGCGSVIASPSVMAKGMLWKLARAADPKRSFWDWS